MPSFNATRHKIGYLVENARDTTADIIAVLLQSTGLETAGAMADHAELAALLAATTNEAVFTNYARKILAAPSVTVDNAGDRVKLSCTSPITWSLAGGATNNTIGMILYCYKPDPASVDSAILPLMGTVINATTDGNDLVVTVHADGFAVVS